METIKTYNKQTDATAIMLYSLKKEAGHEGTKDKSTNKKTMIYIYIYSFKVTISDNKSRYT